jgi:hypothetical protein
MSEIQITGKELIEKAREIIQKLIDTGAKSWSLHIPARVNEDPDLILSRVVNEYEATRKELEELQDAIAMRARQRVAMGNNSKEYHLTLNLIYPGQGLRDEILINAIKASRERANA